MEEKRARRESLYKNLSWKLIKVITKENKRHLKNEKSKPDYSGILGGDKTKTKDVSVSKLIMLQMILNKIKKIFNLQ